MKRYLIVLLTAFLLCSCACGHAEQNDSMQESSRDDALQQAVSEQENAISMDDYYLSMPYDPYWLLGYDSPFAVAMRENPIDVYADERMEGMLTAKDMTEGLISIFELWKTEMQATLQQLQETITEPALWEQLQGAQEAWELSVDQSIKADKAMLSANGWSTELSYQLVNARIRHYRERTIHLKYLLYIYSDLSTALQFQSIG